MSLLVREPAVGEELLEGEVEAPRPAAVVLRPELVLLGAAALGAAVLHAAFAPGHFEEDWAHGLFFALCAWAQLALAIALVTVHRRWVYALGLLNAGVIAVWVVSRTTGLPFGPSAGVPEDVGIPDLVATGLEAVLVLGCAALLLRARATGRLRVARGPRWLSGAAAFGCIVVAAASTAALTPRYASEHQHGAVNPATGVASDGHNHGGATGGAAAGGTVPVLTGNTPCEKSGPPASEGSITDAEGHNHRGPVEQIPIDQATNEVLQQQQLQARAVAALYPTVADAEKAGYVKSTPFVPCIGAHYTNVGLVIGGFDPSKPSELLFDGTRPDSKIIGLSYLLLHTGGAPDGFAGPNDHWHQHNANGGLCFSLSTGIVIGSEATSPEDCAKIGGQKRELTDIWMLHDWVVPGWECSWGVFAPECPELGGKAGFDAWTQ